MEIKILFENMAIAPWWTEVFGTFDQESAAADGRKQKYGRKSWGGRAHTSSHTLPRKSAFVRRRRARDYRRCVCSDFVINSIRPISTISNRQFFSYKINLLSCRVKHCVNRFISVQPDGRSIGTPSAHRVRKSTLNYYYVFVMKCFIKTVHKISLERIVSLVHRHHGDPQRIQIHLARVNN